MTGAPAFHHGAVSQITSSSSSSPRWGDVPKWAHPEKLAPRQGTTCEARAHHSRWSPRRPATASSRAVSQLFHTDGDILTPHWDAPLDRERRNRALRRTERPGSFFPCRGLTRSAPQGRARAWVCSDDRGVGEQRAGCGAGRHVPDGYPGARRRSFTTGRRGTARSGPEGTVTRRRFWVSSIHSSSPNAGAELNFLSTFRASFGSSSESSSPRLARVSPSSRLRNEDGAGGRLPFWARTTKRFTNRFTGTEVVCPSAPSSSFCFTHRGRHATLTPRASPRSSLRAFP